MLAPYFEYLLHVVTTEMIPLDSTTVGVTLFDVVENTNDSAGIPSK